MRDVAGCQEVLLGDLIERVLQDSLRSVVAQIQRSDEISTEQRDLLTIKAVGQIMDHTIDIEDEIYLGEQWVLSGLLSHIEQKYRSEIEMALNGVFKLLESIAQHSTPENLRRLLHEIEQTLSKLVRSPNQEFRALIEQMIQQTFDNLEDNQAK